MDDLDHAALVDSLLPAVLAAGAAQLRLRSRGFDVALKADSSPVTAADREAESLLVDALARLLPDVPVIAEEAVAAGLSPAPGRRAVLVDALDGTREFISGRDDFTINIALVRDGLPEFGMVMAPASGRLFATRGPRLAAETRMLPQAFPAQAAPVVWRPLARLQPRRSPLRVLVSRSHVSEETLRFVDRLGPTVIERLGSSLKLCKLACDEGDVYPRIGPTSAWDIAAGHAILVAAGGCLDTLAGEPMHYLDEPGRYLNPSFVAWRRPDDRDLLR